MGGVYGLCLVPIMGDYLVAPVAWNGMDPMGHNFMI